MTRRSWRSRPSVDGLEDRQLLSTRGAVGSNPLNVRAFSYRTSTGALVGVTVQGNGNLYGTNVGADGGLNLVYGGTNAASKIVVVVRGGGGHAALDSIEEAGLASSDYTGDGGQLLGSLLASQLDLVDGGQINMTSGVGRLQLRSLGANTQIHLRELPETFLSSVTSTNTTQSQTAISTVSQTGTLTSTSGGGGTIVTGTGGTTIGTTGGGTSTGTNTGGNSGTGTSSGAGTGTGTSPSQTPTGTTTTSTGVGGTTGTGTTGTGTTGTGTTGTGTTGTGTTTGSNTLPQSTNSTFTVTTTTVVTGGNGNPVTIPAGEQAVQPPAPVGPVAPTTYSFAGRTLTYANSALLGSTTLTSVSGVFTPTLNLISTPNPANPAPPTPPPGVVVQVNSVHAVGGLIGDGQIYGYDPTLNDLVRFDAITGAVTGLIPVGGTPTTSAGVGLGRNGSELVVLLARGTTVQAFDASTGAPVGAFSAADLAGFGVTAITGVAYTGTATVLTSPNPLTSHVGTAAAGSGIAVTIDVTKSLASQVAWLIGTPFGTDNGFVYAGGATGVAGSNTLFVTGGAPFNSFQPTQSQEGVQTLTGAATGSFRAATPTAFANLNNASGTTPFLPFGSTGRTKTDAGSIENLLAIDTGVSNGANTVTLYTPSLAVAGAVALADPDPIVALSESFHPELAGSALVDVQGNMQSFTANTATGLALNVAGNLDMVQIHSAADSTILGQPLSHVLIAKRSNVALLTSSRSVGTRNGVTINSVLGPLGPLSLPD